MAISIICAWIAVLALLLTALKYLAKKNKIINRLFRYIHIPAGILLIVTGLIHGILAGNSPGASLSEISFGSQLFSLNAGTICFILAIALGLSYLLRKQLKKAWIIIHRILTVMILAALVIHLFNVGISFPELLKGSSDDQTVSETVESNTRFKAKLKVETQEEEETEYSETSESETTVTAEVTDETEQNLPEQVDITFSGAKLNDGTYEGSADGFKSTISVSVTVEGGAVTSVDVLSQSETPRYWDSASALTDTIVSEQSLEVDAVSGATFSSKGILCAVYDALEEAVYEGDLQITIPETSGRRH